VLTHTFSVTILGAGHGGLGLAGYLSRQGQRVTLWNRSPAPLAPVRALGGIRLASPGSPAAFAPVAMATGSMAEALSEARRVLVAVPASAHADIARACAPHLRDGQTVLLLPGRTGGALEFRRELRRAGCRARILLGEASTFPIASRCVGPAEAVIFGTKSEILAAALPACRTSELLSAWRPLLPMLSRARSVLHTGLANFGAVLHPIITLLNAARIQGRDSFDFYTEGVTPRVAAALASADEERLGVAAAYGIPACSLRDWIAGAYGHRAGNIQSAVGGNPAYVGIKAPNTIVHRYLLEDVPTGLIPLIELGKAAGLAMSALRGLVELSRAKLGDAVWGRERTLKVLGLDGLDSEAIRRFVETDVVRVPQATRPQFLRSSRARSASGTVLRRAYA
jgi:opine dehydrogenase